MTTNLKILEREIEKCKAKIKESFDIIAVDKNNDAARNRHNYWKGKLRSLEQHLYDRKQGQMHIGNGELTAGFGYSG
jgi:hypothetical protein